MTVSRSIGGKTPKKCSDLHLYTQELGPSPQSVLSSFGSQGLATANRGRRRLNLWNHGSMADEPLDLIVADAEVLHGQARIRGTRIAVSVVLDCLAAGMDEDEIRRQYPMLPAGSVRAALSYAARLAHEELYPLEPAPG